MMDLYGKRHLNYFKSVSVRAAVHVKSFKPVCILALGASINTARTVRTVKLLNGIENVWSSDLSDRKIEIILE
jgi:hypothetical protein